MLEVADNFLKKVDGKIAGSINDVAGWPPLKGFEFLRVLNLNLGDPQSGSFIALLDWDRMEFPEGQPRPEHGDAPLHHHRSPSFRIALGPLDNQMYIDRVWYGNGDYFVMDANKKYLDPSGVDGGKILLIVADRRGVPIIVPGQGMMKNYGGALHLRDEDALTGIAVTSDTEPRGGRIKGSIKDPSGWARLSDGSSIMGVLLTGQKDGPMVIMSRNAANAIECPAAHASTDELRLIVEGSCAIGGKTFQAGEFIATEAGAGTGEIVHGPQGSTQITYVMDRTRWAPTGIEGGGCARIAEIDAILTKYFAADSPAEPVH
jgi:hypothetical protein